MKLIFFLQTLLGILFVVRTSQLFRARALLSTALVTKAGTIFVCSALFGAIFCGENVFAAVLTTCANLFCAFATLFWCERRQFDALKGEIPYFLDRWILNLRLGLAPTSARERALRDHSENFQALLRPVFTSSSTRCVRISHTLLPPEVICELEYVQHESHSALKRLETLRDSLRKAAIFRRKSGQAVRQTQIQALLMMFLLLALTVFTLQRYGWRQVSDLVLASLLLSTLGALVMYFVARKSRWKV